MIALHTLVGVAFLSISATFFYGLLVSGRRPPPWLLAYRRWTGSASPLTRRFIADAAVTLALCAAFAGLNLAFDYHPLGLDYHRPWTYAGAIFPIFVTDLLATALGPKKPYSAVTDDWLLWGGRSEETTKHSL